LDLSIDAKEPCSMTPTPYLAPRQARAFGLVTPLVVLMALVVLLLLPNLIMHTGLHSNATPTVTMIGPDPASKSAATAVESPPVMR
jgi:hypothetical protein